MKIIGLIGGMSWESSAIYYRLINHAVQRRLGSEHSARCLLLSVDFAEVGEFQRTGDWEGAGRMLAQAADSLERGGADCIVLCTNTMHEVASTIASAVHVPFLHIADATADRVLDSGLSTVALLGTRYTMEREFYRAHLERRGLTVIIPDDTDRTMIHNVIFKELILGRVDDGSRFAYRAAIERLVARGAQGVILGCTEIGMLIGPHDVTVPTFDTARLHAERAVEFALADDDAAVMHAGSRESIESKPA